MGMIWVDNAIIALLVIYTLIGVIRGFNQEVFSIIVWFIGIIVAWFYSQYFAILLLKFISTSLTRLAASFVALIFITLVMGGIINVLLGESVKKTGLTFLDHLGGLILGFGHGLVVVFVMIVVAGLTPLPKDRWWQESKLIPPFQSLASLVKDNSSSKSKLASSINYR
jgi:membrane protein required for colicin V production